jgi:hypothetical protein
MCLKELITSIYKTMESIEECSICQSTIIDKIHMTCSSRHPYCFECLLKSVETTLELKSCPLCRGGDKFIMLDNLETISSDNFYSLYMFKKSIPIIQKVMKEKQTNTCLISDKMLLFYVNNKIQLEFSRILKEEYETDEIIPIIRWNSETQGSNSNSSDLGNFFSNIASELVFGQNGGHTPQYSGQTRNSGQTENVYAYTFRPFGQNTNGRN